MATCHPDGLNRKAMPVNEHFQVEAFLHAAVSMRENRYWERNLREQLAFLCALRDVMTEVCFNFDRNGVLDPIGLAAFEAAVGAQDGVPWRSASAGTVLLPESDEAIQRCLAAAESTDNTGGESTAWPTSLGQPVPAIVRSSS